MILSRANGFLLTAILLLTSSVSTATDWPMWRFDTQRRGASPEMLADQLHLEWSRQLAAPRPAWPNESRLHFDASYEPIVYAGRIFLGSMVDGSVTAYDLKTGERHWRFFTDGPVRLAPVAVKDKLYFGSDDGWLYCLDCNSGKQIWKASGAPKDRAPHRHLGNASLVSFWPVRGGPVVADDVVYFGSGIWPTLGVFVYAVDAQSGEQLWSNNDSHAIENVRIDHNYVQESGISPQGHMLVRDEMLIVPNGRSMPARFDRKTGKLKYFVQGYRNGDSRVTVSGDIALVGNTGVVSLKDGREVASRWAKAGKDAPKAWSSKVDLFEGPLFAYKLLPGLDYRSTIDGEIAYGIQGGVIYAYDLKQAKTSLYEKEFNKNPLKPARWDAPLLWKLEVGKGPNHSPIIKAGGRLYSYAGKDLVAVSIPEKADAKPTISWKISLEAAPTSLLAADGKLLAVMPGGQIRCYGSTGGELREYPRETQQLEPKNDKTTERVSTILSSTSASQGYAVVLGIADGRLVEELLQQSQLKVVAVDESAEKLNTLRQQIADDGRFANRFQAIVDGPDQVTLPPYIANLIVSERPTTISDAAGLKHVFSALRPYGGTACLEVSAEQETKLTSAAKAAKLPGLEMSSSKPYVYLMRVGALPGSADWTHEMGDAARSFFSKDDLIKAPLAVLWYGDGPDHGFYKRKDYGHGVKPQVAGGRMFAIQVATNTLHAVDAYTGRLLWVSKLKPSARYASMAENVVVAMGRECLILDPATGKTQQTFSIETGRPAEEPVSVTDIRVTDDIILLAVRFNKENAISKGRWNSKMLVALDRASGKQLWKREAAQRYNTAAVAMAAGKVFCIDSHSPEEIAARKRRGVEVGKLPSTILALDARSGKVLWQQQPEDPPQQWGNLHFMSMRSYDDWLAYSIDNDLLITGKAKRTYAFEAKTGKPVWQKDYAGNQPLILGPETFINQSGMTFDIHSGEVINGKALFKRGGCNYAVGNKHLVFLRSSCAAYVDVESRQQYNLRNLRSGCSNSLVAADGLLNVPCFSVGCVCNYPIQTSFSMYHLPKASTWHGTGDSRKQELPVEKTPDSKK